ncbi:MAG: hypothetical protein M0D55_06045 [Elusimicrobiota bacterium]|nr:MAG: hypothetical protein M0D55_06045 [Elusimicrobiota bacterium]
MKRLLVAAVLLAACAHPKPVLYPDDHYKAVGEKAAEADVTQCVEAGKAYLKANPAKRVGKSAVRGGVFGAVMGTVFGAFTGNYARAVSQGAAVGAAGGAVQGAWEAGSPTRSSAATRSAAWRTRVTPSSAGSSGPAKRRGTDAGDRRGRCRGG